MNLFEIRSATGFPIKFAATEIFGGTFVVVGDRFAEGNVEGIIECLRRNAPGFSYGDNRIMWVTRTEEAANGARTIRELFLPEETGSLSFEWSHCPYSFDHQLAYVQHAILGCEAVLAES